MKKILRNGLKPIEKFHLDPALFPRSTQDLIPVEKALEFGVLPLGEKHKKGLFGTQRILNLGMVQPKEAPSTIANLGDFSQFHAIQIYRLEGAEFLSVIEEVYRIPMKSLTEPGTRLYPELQAAIRNMKGEQTEA